MPNRTIPLTIHRQSDDPKLLLASLKSTFRAASQKHTDPTANPRRATISLRQLRATFNPFTREDLRRSFYESETSPHTIGPSNRRAIRFSYLQDKSAHSRL